MSDEEGIASVVWTLGPEAGEQEATASLEGADGSPLTYTAIATPGGGPSGPTIQVRTNSFEPATVTINVGETVTWVWASASGWSDPAWSENHLSITKALPANLA